MKIRHRSEYILQHTALHLSLFNVVLCTGTVALQSFMSTQFDVRSFVRLLRDLSFGFICLQYDRMCTIVIRLTAMTDVWQKLGSASVPPWGPSSRNKE